MVRSLHWFQYLNIGLVINAKIEITAFQIKNIFKGIITHVDMKIARELFYFEINFDLSKLN